MIVAGIDVGSFATKVVVLKDSNVTYDSITVGSEEAGEEARRIIDSFLKDRGLRMEDLKCIVSTGVGRKGVSIAHLHKVIPLCLSKGARWLFPTARTIIDIGADSSTVVAINGRGMVENVARHDKCAAGTGVFLEAMAKLLQMPLGEMAKLSLLAEERAEITSTCTIFAEQEVISHIHKDPPTPINDIIAGIHGSLAARIVGLAKTAQIEPEVVLCGGVAKNVGFIKILEEEMGMKLQIPEKPQLVAALGAACLALENL